MAKMPPHPAALDATAVLGQQIRESRIRKKWTVQDLADAIGSSAPTVAGIEKGRPSTAIGTVLSAAVAVGIPLFGAERSEISSLRSRGEEKAHLLPRRVRASRTEQFDDNF